MSIISTIVPRLWHFEALLALQTLWLGCMLSRRCEEGLWCFRQWRGLVKTPADKHKTGFLEAEASPPLSHQAQSSRTVVSQSGDFFPQCRNDFFTAASLVALGHMSCSSFLLFQLLSTLFFQTSGESESGWVLCSDWATATLEYWDPFKGFH